MAGRQAWRPAATGVRYMTISSSDIEALREAKRLLEHPGLAARLSNLVGSPIERSLAALPSSVSNAIHDVTRRTIEKGLGVALKTMDTSQTGTPSNRWHKIAVGASGALGGAFGLTALAIELPISTTIMLRSIADIARSQGEDLRDPAARLECLQVLALGGRRADDDATDAGYFAARTAMAKALSAAAQHVSQKGVTAAGAPAMIKLVTDVASRFSVTVSEKALVQAVPVVGALGGAAINTLFINHFQDMGRGHFTVRRLERIYGTDEVRLAYESV